MKPKKCAEWIKYIQAIQLQERTHMLIKEREEELKELQINLKSLKSLEAIQRRKRTRAYEKYRQIWRKKLA